jgi:hypothetical protein
VSTHQGCALCVMPLLYPLHICLLVGIPVKYSQIRTFDGCLWLNHDSVSRWPAATVLNFEEQFIITVLWVWNLHENNESCQVLRPV